MCCGKLTRTEEIMKKILLIIMSIFITSCNNENTELDDSIDIGKYILLQEV